jgi:lysophospholipid acyltransferase (LPLAT)-like uncharacterized protein
MLKRLGRAPFTQNLLGHLLAGYLRLVKATNRWIFQPGNFFDAFDRDAPYIIALWHGQHFLIPLGKRDKDRYAVLISRHGDGGINAAAAAAFGIRPIRASGGRPDQMHRKGGVRGLREMLRALEDGESVTLTADVPKKARVAGIGIITLAKLSGRPIYPATVVTSRRIDFNSWDRASLGLPFGQGAIVIGDPIRVAADADDAAMEDKRRMLEIALDRVQHDAFALVGSQDPGAELSLSAGRLPA